jgi:hypothetical protein
MKNRLIVFDVLDRSFGLRNTAAAGTHIYRSAARAPAGPMSTHQMHTYVLRTVPKGVPR